MEQARNKAALLHRAAKLRKLAAKIDDETARHLLMMTVAEFERRAAEAEDGDGEPPKST